MGILDSFCGGKRQESYELELEKENIRLEKELHNARLMIVKLLNERKFTIGEIT